MGNVKIGRIVLGAISTNCYFLFNDEINEAVIFDPADEGAKIYEAMKANGFKVVGICLTHGHFDHIYGVAKLKQLSKALVYASTLEKDLLSDEKLNQSEMFGKIATVTPDVLLDDGEEFELGGIKIKMISTPGHTEGSCCYYIEAASILISGDTLFEGSVGRTDMPTGSMSALVTNVKEKLFLLPDETVCYPGHGGATTIGDEKKYNPFLS